MKESLMPSLNKYHKVFGPKSEKINKFTEMFKLEIFDSHRSFHALLLYQEQHVQVSGHVAEQVASA